MHRIDGPGATPDNRFTEGDPTQGVEATDVTADFMNAVQEELAAVIEGAGIPLDKDQNNQLLQALQSLVMPTGTVIHVASAAAPTGFLKANGAAVSRTVYANLYSAIGTTYGPGDGSTTFNLPDLRGEFIRGLDDGRGVDAGRALGSAQGDAFKAHAHAVTQAIYVGGGGALAASPTNYTPTNIPTNSVGGNETRPRNVALLACIKF